MRLRIHDVGIARLGRRLVAITAECHEPIVIANTLPIVRARRAALRVVILRPAIDVVERLGIIDRDLVELRDRQIADEAPCFGVIIAFIQPAIGPEHDVVGIIRAERYRVVIDVLQIVVEIAPRLPAIV